MNEDNRLLKLPFILLKIIVGHLNDNIDKICFTLVSKRLFVHRHKYMYIALPTAIKNSNSYIIKNLHMKSYLDLIESYDPTKSHFKITKISATDLHQITSPNILNYIPYSKSQFNSIVEKDIPNEIDEIRVTWRVNIMTIPMINRIKTLGALCEPINCALPSGIRSLCLAFPHQLPSGVQCFGSDAVLPQNLTNLELYSFNQKMEKGLLPPTLKRLSLGCNQRFDLGVLPHGLEQLILSKSDYSHPFAKGSLPATLKELTLYSYSGNLIFYDSADKPMLEEETQDTYIPSTLEHIAIGTPPRLWNTDFSFKLPNTLKSLELTSRFKQRILSSTIPPSVTKLKFYPPTFMHPNHTRLPRTVKHIEIGELVSSDILSIMPEALETISIAEWSISNLDWLPRSIRSLTAPKSLLLRISLSTLPENIVNINVTENSVVDKFVVRRLDKANKNPRYLLSTQPNQCAFIKPTFFQQKVYITK